MEYLRVKGVGRGALRVKIGGLGDLQGKQDGSLIDLLFKCWNKSLIFTACKNSTCLKNPNLVEVEQRVSYILNLFF